MRDLLKASLAHSMYVMFIFMEGLLFILVLLRKGLADFLSVRK